MTAEVKHISFTLTKEEIKALNKFRKEHKHIGPDFEIKLITSSSDVKIYIRPKDGGEYDWEWLMDYVRY